MKLEKRQLQLVLAVALLVLLSLIAYRIVSIWSQSRAGVAEKPEMAVSKSGTGMVASANRLATEVGIEILKKGGNAVDAAVAAAFALGVVEPFASGIGGGGFMLIYEAKSRRVITIDYRETAPLAATPQMFQPSSGQALDERVKEGHSAVAVPGTMAGLALALKQNGTMDLKTVMGPAVRIAESGYEVGGLLNRMMKSEFGKLAKFPAAAGVYLKDGVPYEVGDRLYLKDLAATYRLIAEKGPDAFYRGEIADAIEREMQSGGGLITKKDLADYRPVVREPVVGSYRGYDIYSMGPPSSGGTHVIQILNILEGYDVAGLEVNNGGSIPLMAEAMKKVFLDRAKFMGDPDFVQVPLKDLLSSEYAAQLRKQIDAGLMDEKDGTAAMPSHESDQTSHLSVMDAEGNMVALTQTINSFFGSGVVVPGTGILLNNEMKDFSPAGSPNSIKPQKRPVSSMSPTLVLKDGRPFMTIGMPGASRIITALPQIISNMVDHKMNIQEAIDAPRIHSISGKEIFMESRIPQTVRDALIRKGYHLTVKKDFDLYFGGAQGVMIDPETGELHGGADPRREGSVMGY